MASILAPGQCSLEITIPTTTHRWVASFSTQRPLPEGLLFLSEPSMPALFSFPPDMDQVPSEVNRLNNQVLVHTYETEWRRWN